VTTDQTKRPEPVTKAGQLAGAIAFALLASGGLLRTLGWLPVSLDMEQVADDASNVVLAGAGLWALVGPWLLARFRARDQVTPLADPQDRDCRPLMSPEEALLAAEFPEYTELAPYLLGAGGMTYDVVRDHFQTLRAAADRRAATAPATDR